MGATGKNTTLISVLPKGMAPSDDSAPLWIQNLTKLTGDGGWVTRPGAGLIARLDSSLTAGKLSNEQDLGLTRVIGSHAFRADFGHELVVILARAQVWATNTTQTLTSQRATVYTLFVYDLTYDTYTEHTLHHHTSEDTLPIWTRHGHYDTDGQVDRQHWYDAGAGAVLGNRSPVDDEVAWFTEANKQLIFGTSELGAWVYSPGLPSPNRTQANSVFARDWKEPFSEDGSVMPLKPREGVFGEGYAYLTPEEFGRPSAACSFGDRVVYAVGNTLLYSDPGEPSAIAALNVDSFAGDITAVISRYGIIYAFTESRTYYINPANGFIVSGGAIMELSTEVGCISPACVTEIGKVIAFVHSSGIYTLTGSTNMASISDPISNLFDGEGLENLWTRLTNTAITTQGTALPQTYVQWTEQGSIGVYLSSDDQGRLFFGLPPLSLCFVYEQGGWAVWSFETIANSDEAVQATRNIPNPILRTIEGRVFVIGDITTQAQVDGTSVAGVGPYENPNRSLALLEIGRGGALDRSSGSFEDKRHFAGEYKNNNVNEQEVGLRDRGYYVIKPPIRIKPNTVLSWASINVGADEAFYLPVELVPTYNSIVPEAQNLTGWYLEFKFDNVNYEPYINANALNAYEAAYNLPTERIMARDAYALATADSAFPKGAMVYDSFTALPDPAGDTIKLYVTSAAGGSWTGHPQFNLNHRHRNPMILFAFRKRAGSVASTFAMGIEYVDGSITDSGAVTTNIECLVWSDTLNEWRTDWVELDDSRAQAVDWGVHASEITVDNAQMKARGINFQLQSSGSSQAPEVAGTWPSGLLNVAMASNRKDVAGQLIDVTSSINTPGITSFEHDSLRARVLAATVQPTFNNGLTWGDDADDTKGNMLVADTATDSINTSGSVKGDKLSISVWGHVRDKAERIKLLAAKAVVRIIGGGPRHRGR